MADEYLPAYEYEFQQAQKTIADAKQQMAADLGTSYDAIAAQAAAGKVQPGMFRQFDVAHEIIQEQQAKLAGLRQMAASPATLAAHPSLGGAAPPPPAVVGGAALAQEAGAGLTGQPAVRAPPAEPAAVYLPAPGPQVSSSSTTARTRLDPLAVAQQRAAGFGLETAGQELAAGQERVGGQLAAATTAAATARADLAGLYQADAVAFANRQRQAEESIDRDLAALKQRKVNPERWIEQRGIGARILLALASMMAGAGAALAKVPNAFPDTINAMIDRDIKAQEGELEGEREAIEGKKNLLAAAYQRFGSMQQARLVTAGLLKEAAADKIDAIKYGNPLSREAAAVASATLRKQAADARVEVTAVRSSSTVEKRPSAPISPAAVAAAPPGTPQEAWAMLPAAERVKVAGEVAAGKGAPKAAAAGKPSAVVALQDLQARESATRATDRALGLERGRRAKLSDGAKRFRAAMDRAAMAYVASTPPRAAWRSANTFASTPTWMTSI